MLTLLKCQKWCFDGPCCSQLTKRKHILDWIVHRPDDKLVQSDSVFQYLLSDHCYILIELDCKHLLLIPAFRRPLNVDEQAFKAQLHHVLYQSPVDQLNCVLCKTLDSHVPASQCLMCLLKCAFGTKRSVLNSVRQRWILWHAKCVWLKTRLAMNKKVYNSTKWCISKKCIHKAKIPYLQSQITNCISSKKLFDISS